MNTQKLFGIGKIGLLEGDRFKPSLLGLAILNKDGDYVCYDAAANTITNVGEMVIEGMDMVYAIPTPIIAVGDLILRGEEPLYIRRINEDDSLVVVNPLNDREEVYIPQKMLFGFRMYVKVFSIMGSMIPNLNGAGDANSFQSMLMPMVLMGSMGKDGGGDNKMMNMLLMSQMFGGSGAGIFGGSTGNEASDQGNMMQMMLMMTLLGDKEEKVSSHPSYAANATALRPVEAVSNRDAYITRVKNRLKSLGSDKEARVRREIDRRKQANNVRTVKWEEIEEIINTFGY